MIKALGKVIRKNRRLYGFLKIITKPLFKLLDYRQAQLYRIWQNNHSETGPNQKNFSKKPLISVIIPTYNTPKLYLRDTLESVTHQTYKNWELIIVDDASTNNETKEIIKEYTDQHINIKSYFLTKNLHIAGATNEGLKHATGDYIALLDHDDTLHKDALAWIVQVVNDNPDAQFIYTDETKMDETGKPYQPFFKPDWNFDFLRSVNYITHFAVMSRGVLKKYGGEDGNYNGTQDWELFLRLTRNLDGSQISHIPKVLYYWRVHKKSTALSLDAKPYVIAAQRKALKEDIKQRTVDVEVMRDENYGAQWIMAYNPRNTMTFEQVPFNDDKLASALKNSQSDIIVFGDNILDEQTINQLAADAARDDIGAVSPRIKDENRVIDNLRSILDSKIVDLIAKMNRRSFTKHIYLTARYNLDGLVSPVLVVERKKLRLLESDTKINSIAISRGLSQLGYRSLYNPHIIIEEEK